MRMTKARVASVPPVMAMVSGTTCLSRTGRPHEVSVKFCVLRVSAMLHFDKRHFSVAADSAGLLQRHDCSIVGQHVDCGSVIFRQSSCVVAVVSPDFVHTSPHVVVVVLLLPVCLRNSGDMRGCEQSSSRERRLTAQGGNFVRASVRKLRASSSGLVVADARLPLTARAAHTKDTNNIAKGQGGDAKGR